MRISLTGKHWAEPSLALPDLPQDALSLLASTRGIDDIASGTMPVISSPSLFAEMGRAVDRILDAMKKKESIVIFGDYDADGITAALQLKRFFDRHVASVRVVLPHRERDGYGLNNAFVDRWIEEGVRLVITVDTGVSATAEIERASKNGIDVIVTDHHTPRHGRPAAYAVLHPRIPSLFPNADLCGAGVAFLLVRGLEEAMHPDTAGWPDMETDFILATIGTVADLVPLRGENRTLVHHGLSRLRKLPATHPIARMVEKSGRNLSSFTSRDIAFILAPRINAGGRIGDPMLAFEALQHDGDAARDSLHLLHGERQELTETSGSIAMEHVDTSAPFLCVLEPTFHVGLIGLVASRLAQAHGKPSLAATAKNGIATGSMRSVDGVNLMDILSHPAVAPLLIKSGGHAQAAGCTFHEEDAPVLFAALSQALRDTGFADDAKPLLRIDAELRPSLLCLDFAMQLAKLEPFGKGNEEPRFLLRNQRLTDARRVGADERHLACMFGDMRAIAFGLGSLDIHDDTDVDIAFRLQPHTWNGRTSAQIVVDDIAM